MPTQTLKAWLCVFSVGPSAPADFFLLSAAIYPQYPHDVHITVGILACARLDRCDAAWALMYVSSFGKNSYARTTPRRPRPEPSSTRPSIIPASSAGTQRQPASQGLRATPSIPRPQPHRLVRPAQLTDHPSVPPDAVDSPIRRKKPPQAISGQPVPSGDRLARDSSPLLPQAAAGAHRRPTVTLTPRSPKAREGIADGRRNHRPRG